MEVRRSKPEETRRCNSLGGTELNEEFAEPLRLTCCGMELNEEFAEPLRLTCGVRITEELRDLRLHGDEDSGETCNLGGCVLVTA